MKRERSIFEKALEFQDAESRGRYLDETCAGDLKLRRRIDNLLKQHDGSTNFILDQNEIPLTTGRVLTQLDDWQALIPAGTAADAFDRLWTESEKAPDVFEFLNSQSEAQALSNEEMLSVTLVDQKFR